MLQTLFCGVVVWLESHFFKGNSFKGIKKDKLLIFFFQNLANTMITQKLKSIQLLFTLKTKLKIFYFIS